MNLAVFGGKPYFSTPQHVGGPIVEPDTRKRYHEYADQAFKRNFLTNGGPLAEELEKEVARIHGVEEAVLIANGFLAQQVLLLCMNLGHGEAIVPANTFIATAHACELGGLTPVFCDLDPVSLNMNPAAAEKLITDKTKLIVPVHIFGVLADMPAFASICEKHGIALLADAAQAFDCDRHGVRPGGFGVPEFLSFHATKYFSTIEGGAILTNDAELAQKARSLRNFGFFGPNDAEFLGLNAKMSEMSAAFGLASLPALPSRRENLHRVRSIYKEKLQGMPGVRVHELELEGRNNYRYFAIFIEEPFPLTRDEVDHVLRLENILPRSYFSPGCHNMGYYRHRQTGLLPETDRVLESIICLPTSFVDAGPEDSANAIGDMFTVMLENAPAIKKAELFKNRMN